VLAKFGDTAVVSKLAAIVKPRADGTRIVRLISDDRRSGINSHVKVGERVVLPRLRDALQDALWMMEAHKGATELGFFVVDVKDAFHTLPVCDDEKHLQVFLSAAGRFEVLNTIVFGGRASPLVWGRAGALMGRSGQALFDCMELLLEIYDLCG